MSEIDLTKLMNESESIIDLEGRLKAHGRTFDACEDYVRWLERTWEEITCSRIDEILNTPVKENGFPTLTVEVEDGEYQLHGIVHGWPLLQAPGWHPRKRMKEYVRKKVYSFYNPSNKEDCLHEENFGKLFDLSDWRDLKDVTSTAKTSGSLIKDAGMVFLSPLVSMLAFFVLPLSFGGAYVYARTIMKPEGRDWASFHLMQKALTDGRYQSKFADLEISQELPQPFNLEMQYLIEKNSKIITQ